MSNIFLSRPFDEDADNDTGEKKTMPEDGPEYAFEGFIIDVNEKVVLTPFIPVNKK